MENRVKNKIAFITGASSGIGKACAEKLAKLGANLILTARRKEILENLKKDLEEKYQIKVLILTFDVRNYDEVKSNIDSLPDDWKNIEILINNAGLAVGLDKFHEYKIDDVDKMIDTNVKGFIYIGNSIIPLMLKTDKVCSVINIGSVAGDIAYPGGSIYCSTKFAVKALSDSMRADLMDKKIKVTNIKPGLVETEFSVVRFRGDQDKADSVYKGIDPLYAEDVAETIVYVANLPDKIQIPELSITPLHQASGIHIFKNN
ncbi:MAG: SDR family NAD(P)-dependent oxidoreductase [Fusobacteriaceae bacterium]|uniref:SDR family NAD(P)-dependent oxidoreductase n=2 Tax=Fusobacterium TaxID=848 RepID=UPI0025B7D801|nr:SDR family NAD(P)-dependent oxidoreductase [Fusobacterium sp.]MCI7224229.1 SDR family NAD(P)-dependent oxidoreductase [Fusobacterium sp.]MDD7392279.1 SDR family NAD(P)-dependent oxidoreductase [Fusobacteriaceae bacterium]